MLTSALKHGGVYIVSQGRDVAGKRTADGSVGDAGGSAL